MQCRPPCSSYRTGGILSQCACFCAGKDNTRLLQNGYKLSGRCCWLLELHWFWLSQNTLAAVMFSLWFCCFLTPMMNAIFVKQCIINYDLSCFFFLWAYHVCCSVNGEKIYIKEPNEVLLYIWYISWHYDCPCVPGGIHFLNVIAHGNWFPHVKFHMASKISLLCLVLWPIISLRKC